MYILCNRKYGEPKLKKDNLYISFAKMLNQGVVAFMLQFIKLIGENLLLKKIIFGKIGV